ncbi:MAG: lactate utilization protein LutB domain-containing protein, partial [Pirellulaceae bacterium]
KIQIPQMLIQLREELHHTPEQKPSRLERLAYGLWARTLRSPRLYRLGSWLVSRTIGWWYCRDRWIKRMPGKVAGWTERRDFPAPAERRFRDWWQEEGAREQGSSGQASE